MTVEYISDIKPLEDRKALGNSAVADGTSTVSVSGDSPDLSAAVGMKLWVDYASNDRRYGVVSAADDVAKTITCDVTFEAGSGMSWGLIDEAEIIDWLSKIHVRDVMVTTDRAGVIDVHHMLTSKAKVLRIDKDTGAWSGDIVDFFNSNPGHPLEDPFEELLANAHTSNRYLYCGSDGPTGYLTTSLTSVVKGLIDAGLGNQNITSDHFQEAMDDLTGGLKHPSGVVQADLDNARTAYAIQVASNARRQAVLTKRAELKNKVQATLDAFDNYYQTADYSVDTDHASAAMTAAENAFTNWTP